MACMLLGILRVKTGLYSMFIEDALCAQSF
jgi:hypothetical protein